MSSAWDESSCYRPRVIPAGKAGCLLEKPLKINRFDANVSASQKIRNTWQRDELGLAGLRCRYACSCGPAPDRSYQRPDLILVQLRVMARWVFGSRSGKVYSFFSTSWLG
ncbi:MAG TPA: hypothetical protein DEF44_15885 [Pseudomonas sp.]|nr:hypothetical protein [Pseudomonas sp.]